MPHVAEEQQRCDPASSNQTHERERADDLKPYGLNRREAREPAPRPQCGPLLLHTPIEAEAFLRASDEQRIYKLQPKPKRPCRFTFLISVVLMHVGMEETPPAEAPAPAPAPPPQSWTMTENGPVPTPQMVRAIQADVRRQRAQAAWEDDPANRPAPGKRRRDGNPLKKRGRDEREVEELEAKLREMKALRERVVEHIAVCKKYGYCGYAKEDDDPSPDTPQPPPPPQQPLPPSPTHSSRVGAQYQADIPDQADQPD